MIKRIIIRFLSVSLVIYTICYFSVSQHPPVQNLRLMVVTMATRETVSYRRFLRSAQVNGFTVRVLGQGNDLKGYGFKLLLIKDELEPFKDDPNVIFLYADAYDVLFNANRELIIEKFLKFDAKILFAAEENCAPEPSIEPQYPLVKRGKRFLSAGVFMGFAPELYRLVTSAPLRAEDDDQLFCSKIYINETLRKSLNMKLDHLSEIFATVNGDIDDVQVIFMGRKSFLFNQVEQTWPLIIHEPGMIKLTINSFGNYIPNVWNPVDGCITCLEDTKDLSTLAWNDLPSVVMAVFLGKGTCPLEEFFSKLEQLDYPKNKIHLFVHNSVKKAKCRESLENFIKFAAKEYNSTNFIDAAKSISNYEIVSPKDIGMEECVKWKCDYYFNVDPSAMLDNRRTLQLLIEQNRKVVAPILFTSDRLRVNVQGIVAQYEYCPSSLDIIKNNRSGLWTVGEVSACYLIDGGVILNPKTKPIHSNQHMRAADAFFSEVMGIHDIELFASNRFEFGHLI